MTFEKDTIMGQVLHQVNVDTYNKPIIDDIKDLMDMITDNEFKTPSKTWNKNGLVITDRDLSTINLSAEDKTWAYVETAYVSEYSWLVFELERIYQPSLKASNRLYSTIGYLFTVYEEKYDDLEIVLRMVTLVSTVWLHPDHIGQDKFMVHPVTLPNFGSEF